MATRPEAPDLAVDELRRRARRRLVGAIVLALAAAVILPLLLESDPKPLGDEVSVRIPPVDSGRFVNPISSDRGRDSTPAPAEPKSTVTPAPKKTIAEAERRVLGQGTAPAATTDAAPPAPTDTSPAPRPDALPKPDATVTSDAPAPRERASTSPAAPVAASVQVGAFADDKVAVDLVAALKAKGFAAYTEAVPTDRGTVQRVRVGPYATRNEADAAAAKLKAAGYERAIVTLAK
jgi:DedD protein